MNPDQVNPPKLANAFLRWFCSKEVLETLQGDMVELYELRRSKDSKGKADISYFRDVFSALRPFAIKKNIKSINSNYTVMFSNYFKVAWRNMLKNRTYSGIKVGGFSLGIAICVLIGLFVQDELSIDQNFPKGDRLYRVIYNSEDPA